MFKKAKNTKIVKNTPSNKNYFIQFTDNLFINPYYNEILRRTKCYCKNLKSCMESTQKEPDYKFYKLIND